MYLQVTEKWPEQQQIEKQIETDKGETEREHLFVGKYQLEREERLPNEILKEVCGFRKRGRKGA